MGVLGKDTGRLTYRYPIKVFLLVEIPFHDVEEWSGSREFDTCQATTDAPQIGILPKTEEVNLIVDQFADLPEGLLAGFEVHLGGLELEKLIQVWIAITGPVNS
jgi:hypothetical protein